ncbi:MAG TPA: TonB-dependent receptor [Steroidobacteraceae bacterium]|nr:TonB-dependent receptor [Steroidobacteraceae bacterium]
MSIKINAGIRSQQGQAALIKASSCGASALTLAVLAILHASPTLAADAAAVEDTALTEIVVTAEKRSENLERVPASITAFTAKTLDVQGIASVQDMTNYAPGLYYTTYDNRPYMRGIGRNTDNLAVESGVAVYVDGIYNGANASTILQNSTLFTDEVEVLRGPQNTLFGRNADGGTINYVSKRPTSDFEAEVRTGYDSFQKAFIEGAFSGPISDSMRYRFGANYTNQTGDGFYKNLNGVDEGGGVAQGGNGTSYHIEGQLEGNIGSDFEWWTKLATSDYDVSYHTETLLGPLDTREFPAPLFPNANFGTCALPGGAGGLGCAGSPDTLVSVLTGKNTIAGNPSSLGTGTFDSGFQSQSKQQNNIIFATHLTFHADGFDVKYLGGWQKFNYDLTAPWTNNQGVSSGVLGYTLQGPAAVTPLCGLFFGATNLAGCTQNLTVNSAHNNFTFNEYEQFFSNEINIASTGSGPVQWIGGLYQFHEKYTQPINVNNPDQAQMGTPYNFLALVGGLTGAIPIQDSLIAAAPNPTRSAYNEYTALAEDSYGIFGQIDWQASSQFKITTGLRYSYDKKDGDQTFRIMAFDAETLIPGVPLGVNMFGANTPAFDITGVATTCNGQSYRGTGACFINSAGQAQTSLDAHWDAVTGVAGISWTPDPSILGYAKYSRGYKAGGFNSGINAVDPETSQETVDAFEVGYKETFGKTFQANLATFYYNYKNDQQPLGELDPTNNVINTIIVNIPTVHTYGAELETIWNPITDLDILMNYAYLHATISSTNGVCYQDAADPLALTPGASTAGCAPGLQNLRGATLPASPRNKVSLNAIYTLHFNPGSLALSGAYIWRDKTYDSVFNFPYNLAPSYSLVNLRGIWTDTANRYNVILYANNVFNRIGQDASGGLAVTNPGPGQVIDPLVSYTPPRVYGVELRYRFH